MFFWLLSKSIRTNNMMHLGNPIIVDLMEIGDKLTNTCLAIPMQKYKLSECA